jgi:hypothetical protein
MKIVGLIVIVLGWLIAVSSVEVSSTGAQLVLATLGFLISCCGVIGILNKAHLKNALWKQ